MSDRNVAHGTVIITDNQTAGKGQRGNRWESAPGQNLTFSVLVKPSFLPVSQQFELTVVTSLAIVKVLADFGIKGACIKWPNDIYTDSGKIAGILIENIVRSNQLEWAVLGIGLNVNQIQFGVEGATSMKRELGDRLELDQVLDKLFTNLNRSYQRLQNGEVKELRDDYTKSLMWVGQSRAFFDCESGDKIIGTIQRVTEDGRLVVRSGEKDMVYDFKQLEFVG